MPQWLSDLAKQAPQLVYGYLAARQGGPMAYSAFQQGLQQAAAQRAALQRQAQLDAERQQTQQEDLRLRRSAEARAINSEGRADEEAQRRAQEAEIQRKMEAFKYLSAEADRLKNDPNTFDPVAAESSLFQRATGMERLAGIPAGDLSQATPSLTTFLAPKKAKAIRGAANAVLDRVAKNDSVRKVLEAGGKIQDSTLQGLLGEDYKDGLSLQDLARYAEMQATSPDGQALPFQFSTPERAVEPGSFGEYVNLPPDQQAIRRKQRKDYMQADDRPAASPVVVIQTTDAQGNPVTRVVPRSEAVGQSFSAAPTADMRNKAAGRALVQRSIGAIEQLSQRIITKVGPQQRADALRRGTEAVFGSDPEFRTYQDARTALAGNLAVAQQGSRPSDADIKAIWLPLVPDAYRDTADSARMKWDLIKTMSNAESAAPPRIYYDENGNPVSR